MFASRNTSQRVDSEFTLRTFPRNLILDAEGVQFAE
jgi:hypothetical protein